MAISSAMRDAAIVLVGQRPATFFGASGQFEREITSLINEVAEDIAQYRDWQSLLKVAVVTPNGGTEYALPADYGRMTLTSAVQSTTSWLWGYFRYDSVDSFLHDQTIGAIMPPGGWIIYGDALHFFPVPNGPAQFPYITNEWARADDGALKAGFTEDTDTFLLPERLLKLGLIWRWRESKKLDYSGDQEAFIKALDEYASKDGGSRVQRYGGRSLARSLNVGVAWPGGWW